MIFDYREVAPVIKLLHFALTAYAVQAAFVFVENMFHLLEKL